MSRLHHFAFYALFARSTTAGGKIGRKDGGESGGHVLGDEDGHIRDAPFELFEEMR
jgi:hypothetical protein